MLGHRGQTGIVEIGCAAKFDNWVLDFVTWRLTHPANDCALQSLENVSFSHALSAHQHVFLCGGGVGEGGYCIQRTVDMIFLIDLDLPGTIDPEEQKNLYHCLQTHVLKVEDKTSVWYIVAVANGRENVWFEAATGNKTSKNEWNEVKCLFSKRNVPIIVNHYFRMRSEGFSLNSGGLEVAVLFA